MRTEQPVVALIGGTGAPMLYGAAGTCGTRWGYDAASINATVITQGSFGQQVGGTGTNLATEPHVEFDNRDLCG